jgi:hypothetical protein
LFANLAGPYFESALVLIAPIRGAELKPETLANVRLGAHNGLKSDIAPCPKSARSGSQRRGVEHPNQRRGGLVLIDDFLISVGVAA